MQTDVVLICGFGLIWTGFKHLYIRFPLALKIFNSVLSRLPWSMQALGMLSVYWMGSENAEFGLDRF